MKDLFPVEQEIYDRLNERAQELYAVSQKNSVWTMQFKEVLYDLGRKRALSCWGIGAGEGYPEWMWDVVWAKVGFKDGEDIWQDFRGIFLAAEIEWGMTDDARIEDFIKLVVARADYRLFIFATKTDEPSECDEIFKTLMNLCPGSVSARYLAIAAPYNRVKGQNLPYKAWTL